MSSNLATRVQHHPSRAGLLTELLPRLDGLDPQVITDPGGGRRSTWRTHRMCLESIPDDATHLLCVQDDGWPCENFAARVHNVIEAKPDRIVALFVSGIGHLARAVNIARKQRSAWLELPPMTYVPLVAVVYPADVARSIPEFADAKKLTVGRADDAVVGQFCRARRMTACAVLPSLVEHRDEVESVMLMPSGRGAAHRLAAWYVESPA